MKLTNRTIKHWIILIALVIFIVIAYFLTSSKSTFDSQSFIRISGIKPEDASVKAWANYWVTGDECGSYSYDLFGRKAHRGGKMTRELTDDFAQDNSRYELRVPYADYVNQENCIVELRDITVEAHNAFDSVGFAQLRIYQGGNDYNNKPISLDSKIEAKNCDSYIRQFKDKSWAGGLGCYFYIDQKKNLKIKSLMLKKSILTFHNLTMIR